MHLISRPKVPSVHPIHEFLRAGSDIHIKGKVNHDYRKNFTVELLSGPNVVLHIGFLFHKDDLIVMNTSTCGIWGHEIQHRNPLHKDYLFDLRIHVHATYYEITLNGSHLADFPHRYSVESVQAIGLQGSVEIEKITFTGFSFLVDWDRTYDYGHGGYLEYGTEQYKAPEFREGSAQKAFFAK